jgi:hypothetical protein
LRLGMDLLDIKREKVRITEKAGKEKEQRESKS